MTTRLTMCAALVLTAVAGTFARSKPADEILAADNAWARAFAACDTAGMEKLLGDDLLFIYYDAKTDTKPKFMASFARCYNERARSEEQTVRVYGDTGVVTGVLRYKNKTTPENALVYTRVFVRRGGAWRLVSHQSTDVPAPAPPKS